MSDLDELFSDIAPILTDVSQRKGPRIEKYYQNQPVWDFGFLHPSGGYAHVTTQRADSEKLFISGSWWVDDYDAGVRHIRWLAPREVKLPSSLLGHDIEAAIDEIAGWRAGTWTQEAGGMAEHWQRYSKSEFESMQRKWPSLRR